MSQLINFIKLDFNRSNNITIPTIEWDQGSRFVRVQLQNNNQSVDITGSQVAITVIRNDLEEIIESCNILNAKEGLIEFEISKSMVARQGDMLCQLKLSDNDSVLSSQLFKISVNNTLMISLEESRSDMDVLIHALGEVQDINNRFNQTNAQLSQNQTELIKKINEVASIGTTEEVLKTTTENYIREQIDNGSIATMTIENGKIDAIKTNFAQHINIFDKENIAIGKALNVNGGLHDLVSASSSFVCNEIYPVKKGDIIRSNLTWVTFFIYDANGTRLKRYEGDNKKYVIEQDEACYMRFHYGNYSEDKVNKMMVTINRSVPRDYVGYDVLSIPSQEITDIQTWIDKKVMAEDTNFASRVNVFNKNDISVNKALALNPSSSLIDIENEKTVEGSFLCNQIWEIKNGDIVRTNLTWMTFLIYDEQGVLLKTQSNSSTDFTVENEKAKYLRLVYGNYSEDKVNKMMVTINRNMPSSYTPYNRVSIDTYEINEIKEQLSQTPSNEKTYIILDFDGCNNVYENRYKLVYEQYGFPFTFIATGKEIGDNVTVENLREMVANGCDISVYSNDVDTLPSDSTINDTSKESLGMWDNYVRVAKSWSEDLGFYNPVMWSCRQNRWGTALEYAVKKHGFKLARGGSAGLIDDNTNYLIPANGIYSNNLESMKSLLDSAIETKKSALFFTHRLVDTLEEDGGWDCLKSVYIEFLDYLKDKVNQGLCEVVTAREFYNIHHPEDGHNNDYQRILKTIWHNTK